MDRAGGHDDGRHGAGIAYGAAAPVEWRASASIELPDVPIYIDLNSTGRPPSRVSIDTTGQLVLSEPVLEAASRASGMAVEEVYDQMTISAYPLSRVIIITLVAPTLRQAEDGANAAADELVVQRGSVLAGSDQRSGRKLSRTLRRLVRNAVADLGYSSQVVKINAQMREITENTRRYSNIKSRVVNRAAPGRKVQNHIEVYVVTGAVTGFMLGVVYIWWRPRRRASGYDRVA